MTTRPPPLISVNVCLERWAQHRIRRILEHRKDLGGTSLKLSAIVREFVQSYLNEHPELDPYAEARERLIVTLDGDVRQVLEMVSWLKGRVGMFHIGDVSVVEEMAESVYRETGPVLLDIPDAPRTVRDLVDDIIRLIKNSPCAMLSIPEMGEGYLKIVAQAVRRLEWGRPRILVRDINPIPRQVRLIRKCGLDGIVVSDLEIIPTAKAAGLEVVCQNKKSTPLRNAIKAGADYVLVACSDFRAVDLEAAADRMVADIAAALDRPPPRRIVR